MSPLRYRPREPLGSFVECIWWSRKLETESFAEHMLASGRTQLIFALHDAPFTCVPGRSSGQALSWSHSIVHGPQWGFYRAGPKPAGTTVGISFRPGAAGAILGVPVADLADQHVPLDALWGWRARELREKLLADPSPRAIFERLESELAARIEPRLLIHPAIAHALRPPAPGWPPPRVADVQRAAGYSPRHFIALFRTAVGLTPKHFFRVTRFVSAARELALGHVASLADLAASAGYADQAHLTREFREFAGTTPARYRPSSPDAALHHRVTALFGDGFAPGKKDSRPR